MCFNGSRCYSGQWQVYTAYTDFEKVFDKVDHGILLFKLRSISFSVVPQVFILEPLLFIIFITTC